MHVRSRCERRPSADRLDPAPLLDGVGEVGGEGVGQEAEGLDDVGLARGVGAHEDGDVVQLEGQAANGLVVLEVDGADLGGNSHVAHHGRFIR